MKKKIIFLTLLIASFFVNVASYSEQQDPCYWSEFFQTEENKISQIENSYSSAIGYGEISTKTGRPKTVHVNGYHRKDGTSVKPHYRSPPKKKEISENHKLDDYKS